MLGLTLWAGSCSIARAQVWTTAGNTWTYRNAISLDVSTPFKVVLNEQTLSLTAQDGAVSLTFVGAHGQSDLSDLTHTINQTLFQNNATMKPQSHTIMQNGVEMAFKEGDLILKLLPYDVTVVVMGHQDDFVLCQLLMPKQATGAMTPLLDSLFSSVRASKGSVH